MKTNRINNLETSYINRYNAPHKAQSFRGLGDGFVVPLMDGIDRGGLATSFIIQEFLNNFLKFINRFPPINYLFAPSKFVSLAVGQLIVSFVMIFKLSITGAVHAIVPFNDFVFATFNSIVFLPCRKFNDVVIKKESKKA